MSAVRLVCRLTDATGAGGVRKLLEGPRATAGADPTAPPQEACGCEAAVVMAPNCRVVPPRLPVMAFFLAFALALGAVGKEGKSSVVTFPASFFRTLTLCVVVPEAQPTNGADKEPEADCKLGKDSS